MTSKERGERFSKIFKAAGFNVKNVSSLGDFVHVDTFKEYGLSIIDAMQLSGFSLIYEKDGLHLSGFRGLRLSFQKAA